jgi:hypothetical protein
VDTTPPNGSERTDPADDFLVRGDRNVSVPVRALVPVGVAAGLTPLLLVPLDCGVLCVERPGQSIISRGGDLDFFRDSEEPVMPSTSNAVILHVNDAITFSAIIYESSKT